MSYSHINIHKNYVNKIDVINLNNVKKRKDAAERKKSSLIFKNSI